MCLRKITIRENAMAGSKAGKVVGISHVGLGMPGGAIDTILQALKNQWNYLSASFSKIFLVLWKLECKGIYRKNVNLQM